MTRYVVITPVRDEEEHVESTIQSMLGQTMRPAEWIIVNDGSTDGTGAILERYAAQIPWIHVIHRANRGFRKAGGGVVEAFYEGYDAIACRDWDFVVKLDGDLSFEPTYFKDCFGRFAEQPQLGIGGGDIYNKLDSGLTLEPTPRFHVRGATKIYRRACWEAIGGLIRAAGWDTIDEVKANMLGWKTSSFKDQRLVHHRPTGAADGLLRDRMKYGRICFTCGYHPVFVLARCTYRIATKPYLIGSVAMLVGYLKAYFTNTSQVDDKRLIRYLRGQQLRCLLGMRTVWK